MDTCIISYPSIINSINRYRTIYLPHEIHQYQLFQPARQPMAYLHISSGWNLQQHTRCRDIQCGPGSQPEGGCGYMTERMIDMGGGVVVEDVDIDVHRCCCWCQRYYHDCCFVVVVLVVFGPLILHSPHHL